MFFYFEGTKSEKKNLKEAKNACRLYPLVFNIYSILWKCEPQIFHFVITFFPFFNSQLR